MAGAPGFEEVERLGAAHLADRDAIGRRRSEERTRSDSETTPSLVRMATRLGAAHCSSRVSSIRTIRSVVLATSASSALTSVVLPAGAARDEDVGAAATPSRSAAASAADMIPAAHNRRA
jgi:hypothetical protein